MDEKDRIQALIEKPFEFSEHGYLDKAGYYILKSALRDRLNQLSPRWRNTAPELMHMEDDLVVMRGGLTLFGETRYAIGTGIIQRTRYDKATKTEVPLGSFEISRQKAKAMKSAARDLLPRAALEHGIGEYIRDMPKKVKDGSEADFKDWLNSLRERWTQRWPQHWAFNGGGKMVSALMTAWDVPWATVAAQIEPGKTLTRLSDTSLTLVEFIARLGILKSYVEVEEVEGDISSKA